MLDVKREKYCLIKQMTWNEYINQHNSIGIIRGENIYLNSFNDVCSYVAQELLTYYLKYCKTILSSYERQWKLRDNIKFLLLSGEYEKPKNLRAFQFIYSDYRDYHIDKNNDIEGIDFLPEQNRLLSDFISETIEKIANNVKVEYFYSFPIRKEEVTIKAMWNKEKPISHHRKSCHWALPQKRLLALSQDKEIRQYLDARDMFKGNYWRHKGIRHNKHSYIPGDWKHYHKCRKQWAKNIDNPSYEKLSKVVRDYELNFLEDEELE